ncbi:MAG TPA: PRC-barrel domain-containing protein [Ilumatobacteraceae bacterium]|nr:PRC-barrel domain-containing protein [Ilumatobacteraceae bacterium]HUC32395.1 PRC-barrel domain-containing protein [Ilumatobacteraceae bacterium]
MKTGSEVWRYDPNLDATTSTWEGYEVEARDGSIGKIDEMNTETGRGCVVVDTGPWIFGKKRMIPAACVTSVDHGKHQVHVSLTKEQIKDAPDYDAALSTDTAWYDDQERYYGTWL